MTGTRENYELEKTDFWLKLSPSCEEAGVLDQDPLLVYGEKTETDPAVRGALTASSS